MPVDSLWTFVMACNFYLTFFHKYNSEQFRRLEWKYVTCCYGLPFNPAFTFVFINTPAKGPAYGSATVRSPSPRPSRLDLISFCQKTYDG